MQGQTPDTVKRVVFVGSFQLFNGQLVGLYLGRPGAVVTGSANLQDSGKVCPPSWSDLVQNG